MAKPADITPAQEVQLRKSLGMQDGADLTKAYNALSESRIRELAGMGLSTPSAPAVSKPPVRTAPAKPATPTPVISTPTVTPFNMEEDAARSEREARGLSDITQVQPESGAPMRSTNPYAGTSSQERIDAALEARRRAVSAAASKTTSGMALSPEAAGEAISRGERLSTAPRTVSGETRVPVARTILGESGERILRSIPIVGDIAAGLAPQIIETPEEKRSRDDAAFKAAQTFFQNNPGFSMTPENFQKVKNSYRYHGGMAGDTPIERAARAALTTVSPTGAVIESPLTTATKGINVGEAAVVTVPQYVASKAGAAYGGDVSVAPSFRETLRGNIASGANLMTATSEGAAETARIFGASPEVQDFAGNVGGVLGFGGSLLLPIDLGIGSAGAGALRTGEATLKIGEAFGEAAPSILKPAIKGGIQGGFDAWRIGGKSGVEGLISDQLKAATERWMANPNVDRVIDTTLSLAGEDAVQMAIKADKEAGKAAAETRTAYDSKPYMDQMRGAFEDLRARSPEGSPIRSYATFDDYLKDAERFGIDISNSGGKRAFVLGQPPENVVAKEAKDSLKRTSVGTSSLDYFDELSTGGRSSLYYDAFLNTLDEAQKERLLAGGSLKSGEFYGALDSYVNNIKKTMSAAGKSEADIISVLSAFEKELTGKGIKIPKDRIFGAEAGSEAYKYGGLIINPEIKAALKDSYKVDLARRLKNSLAEKTGITGTSVRIGNIVLSKEDAASAIANAKKNINLEKILKSIKGGNGVGDVSKDEIKALRKYFITRFETGETLRYKSPTSAGGMITPKTATQYMRPTEFYSPVNVMNDIVRIERTGKINAEQYNNLVHAAIALEASSKTSAKTVEKVSQIAGSMAAEGAGIAGKQRELSYFMQNVMSPKDLQQTGMISYLADVSKKITTPKGQSVVANEIIGDVNSQLASLPERFKSAMRRNLVNEDRPNAFARTMIEEFTEGYVYKPTFRPGKTGKVTQVESAGLRPGFPTVTQELPTEVIDIEGAYRQNSGSYEMFRTYIASIYGGYEQTIDSIATTGRTLNLDNTAITTKEMRDLISVVIETPALKPKLEAFQAAIKDGRNIEALNILQRTHMDLYGYSLQQVLTRKAGISEAEIASNLRLYTEAASKRISNENISFFSSKSGINRGIDEAYKAASHQAPVIKPSNFKEMLLGTYYSKSQANIVDEALFKAQSKHPELFPSAGTLAQVAQADWNTTRNALIYNLDNMVVLNQLTDAEKTAYANIRKKLIEETGLVRWRYQGTAGEVSSGTSSLFKEKTPSIVSPLRNELLIAAVEDNVAIMTGGKGPTKRYLDVLATADLFKGATPAETAAVRRVFSKGLDSLETKPGSVYNEMFNTSARSDATVLFYQTSLTNIKNQLKNPYSASLQGVAEKIQTIPLLVAEQASLKRPIFGAANLKSITETISAMKLASGEVKLDQIVAKNGEKLALDIKKMEEAVNGIIDGLLDPKEIELAQKKEQVLADIKTGGEYSFRRAAIEHLVDCLPNNGIASAMSGIAKNGLLGGIALPNIVYMMGNHLTGASIIATTIGLEGAGTAAKSILFLDRDVNEVIKAIYAPAWSKRDRIMFTAPDGTIWTKSMLADLVSSGSIGRSQAQAELSNQLISSSLQWAGKTGLFGDDKSALTKFIQRNFFNIYDMNVWSSLANGTDQMYRTSMLIRGLKNGESVEGAKTLAREALFDYGNLTQIEKDAISKVFWFWTFRRNSWKAVFTSLATDSRGLKAAFNAGNGFQYAWDGAKNLLGMSDEDLDMRYATKDYSESRIFLDLIEAPEFKRRYGIYGPPIPAKQAVADMIDYLSIPLSLAAYERGLVDSEGGLAATTVDFVKLVASQSNPVIQGAATIGFGLDIRTGSETTSYLDPKLMWYLQQNPEHFYTFSSIVGIEPVPFEQENPSVGYYDGRQWRLKKDDYSKRTWAAIRTGLLMIGVQRTLQDYAPIFNMTGRAGANLASGAIVPMLSLGAVGGPRWAASPEGKVSPPIQIDTGNTLYNMMRASGVISPQDAPMIKEIEKRNREAAAREIQGLPITPGGSPGTPSE